MGIENLNKICISNCVVYMPVKICKKNLVNCYLCDEQWLCKKPIEILCTYCFTMSLGNNSLFLRKKIYNKCIILYLNVEQENKISERSKSFVADMRTRANGH